MSDNERRQSERDWLGSGSLDAERRFLAEQIRAAQLGTDRLMAAAQLGHPVALSLCEHPVTVSEDHSGELQQGLNLLDTHDLINFAYRCLSQTFRTTDHPFSMTPGPDEALSWVRDWLNGHAFESEQAATFVNASQQISQILGAQAQAFSWLQENVHLSRSIDRGARVTQAVSHLVAAVCTALDLPEYQETSVQDRVLEAVDCCERAIDCDETRRWQKLQLAKILLGLHQGPSM